MSDVRSRVIRIVYGFLGIYHIALEFRYLAFVDISRWTRILSFS